MIYADARAKIQSGDILAWSGDALFSRLIQRTTRSKYSHVGVAWCIAGRVFALEAIEGTGVRLMPLSHADMRPFYYAEMGGEWTDRAETFALENLGAPYNWFDALRAGLGLPMRRGESFICSEYAREVARFCNHDIPDRVQTPAQLVEWCQHRDRIIRYVV